MKYFLYGLLFFSCMENLLFAQDQNQKELDSLFEVVRDVYEFSYQNKLSEAIKMANEVLEYEKKNRNDSLRARTYNALGVSYTTLKSPKGLEFFLKSKEVYEKLKDTFHLISSYNNLGVYHKLIIMDLEKSNDYFNAAINIANAAKYLKETVHPNFNLADNLINRKKNHSDILAYEKAIAYLTKALNLMDGITEKKFDRIKADIYESLGYAYSKVGRHELANRYFEMTMEYSKSKGYLEVIACLYEDRALLYGEQKEFEAQTKMLEHLVATKDSIYEAEKFDMIKKIESEYFIKENEEKLKFIEKEKVIQKATIEKARIYNIVLGLFSIVLFFSICSIFKKNKELRLAKEKAESLSKIKSDFYSEISHELRTPLYAVIELSNLLLKENINVRHKEYLESLRFSGNHLMALINNVLQLNKVESGKMKIQKMDFDLEYLINSIIESLEYAIKDSNNKINLKYDTNLPKVMVGDSLKLSQVLINLVSNAIKFTNDGHIDILIKQMTETKEFITVHFKVSDDGMGISKEKQTLIFEDFYQEHAKNDKSYKGTGLGLSIVRRILIAMNSMIRVESKEDEGTVFSFELVLGKSLKSDMPVATYAYQIEHIRGCNILIVDDNKINQLVTKKVLDGLGVKSKAVDSGRKAIEIIKNETFDCILMDLHMPELDGYETTEIIRRFNGDIAIVALTAASSDEVEAKIKNYEIDGYVLKPFRIAEFVEAINNAIYKVVEIV